MFGPQWSGAGMAMSASLAALWLAGSAAAAEPNGPPPSPQQPAPNLSTAASGNLVITNPQAAACEDAAKVGDSRGVGVDQCTQALGGALLSQADVVAIYTDRGAVYLQHKQYLLAKSDFDSALKLDASTADAYVNRGAALLGLKQYADAIADIDRGLALRPDHPERAYFNRAIADEHLLDLRSAYQDYLTAARLDPDWEAPKAELTRLKP